MQLGPEQVHSAMYGCENLGLQTYYGPDMSTMFRAPTRRPRIVLHHVAHPVRPMHTHAFFCPTPNMGCLIPMLAGQGRVTALRPAPSSSSVRDYSIKPPIYQSNFQSCRSLQDLEDSGIGCCRDRFQDPGVQAPRIQAPRIQAPGIKNS